MAIRRHGDGDQLVQSRGCRRGRDHVRPVAAVVRGGPLRRAVRRAHGNRARVRVVGYGGSRC